MDRFLQNWATYWEWLKRIILQFLHAPKHYVLNSILFDNADINIQSYNWTGDIKNDLEKTWK